MDVPHRPASPQGWADSRMAEPARLCGSSEPCGRGTLTCGALLRLVAAMKPAILLAALLTGPMAAGSAAAAPSDVTGIATFGEVMGGLQRTWRQDCSAGGAEAKATVVFVLDSAGKLAGEPTATSDSKGPAADAAMASAVRTVKQAESFKTLPAMFLGKTYHVVFDGHAACPSGK